jgi:hypothetical protein
VGPRGGRGAANDATAAGAPAARVATSADDDAFPRGLAGAHSIHNPGDERARVLIISTMRSPDIVEQPDTGATMSILSPGHGKAFPEGTDIPAIEALRRAARVDSEQSGRSRAS